MFNLDSSFAFFKEITYIFMNYISSRLLRSISNYHIHLSLIDITKKKKKLKKMRNLVKEEKKGISVIKKEEGNYKYHKILLEK